VVRIAPGAVNTEVELRIAPGASITAIISRQGADDLGLAEGDAAIALINPSFVILAPADEALRTSARNRLTGTVAAREDGAVNSEITLDLGEGKTLAATVTLESARELDIREGQAFAALVKASHVILVVE
jgi:molybdate transport system regulatory protein